MSVIPCVQNTPCFEDRALPFGYSWVPKKARGSIRHTPCFYMSVFPCVQNTPCFAARALPFGVRLGTQKCKGQYQKHTMFFTCLLFVVCKTHHVLKTGVLPFGVRLGTQKGKGQYQKHTMFFTCLLFGVCKTHHVLKTVLCLLVYGWVPESCYNSMKTFALNILMIPAISFLAWLRRPEGTAVHQT